MASLVGQRKGLLILDGLEPLQYAPTGPAPGQLKDQGIAVLLKRLATSSHGLCIVTTRYSLPDLKAFWQGTAPEVSLERLSREAGVHLLKALGVRGSELRNIPFNCGKEQVNEFEKLVEDVKGHALTLHLLGTYLRDAHGGDIRKRDLVKLEEADAEEQGGHAFRVMDAYSTSFENEGDKGQRALAVLRLVGLFDRPATADCLAALLEAPAIPDLTEPLIGMSETQKNMTLARLGAASLVTVNRNAAGTLVSLDAHPLLREYFARQLREQKPNAWRAAHTRLYKYLCANTKENDHPTLEYLQPLYQAVAHGCHAGLYGHALKVYETRIFQGSKTYSLMKLGAFSTDLGILTSFFERRWDRASQSLTEADQAFVLNCAGSCLYSLGRVDEAVGPMRDSMNLWMRLGHWPDAQSTGTNLTAITLTLGEIEAAISDACKFVDTADRAAAPAYPRMYCRPLLGFALFQAGDLTEAGKYFREAEEIQYLEVEPQFRYLYSLQGFQYCELLLASAERLAWRKMLSVAKASCKDGDCVTDQNALTACHDVMVRATTTLTYHSEHESGALLGASLDRLTLARVGLYTAIIKGGAADGSVVDQSIGGLRSTGRQEMIPIGLLSRAWLRALSDDLPRTQADLDEAWEVAQRGPMRLVMADIHLYRARLFFREAQYPWGSPQSDLVAARKLIEQCGYWRRKEELENAEAAIGSLS